MTALRTGDKVSWKSHGGSAHGTVVKKQTSRTRIKGHIVAASRDEPHSSVETDKGDRAAHKPAALRRQ